MGLYLFYMMAADLDSVRFADFYDRRVLQSAASFIASSTAQHRGERIPPRSLCVGGRR